MTLKYSHKGFLIAAAVFSVVSCAEKRDTEKVLDFEGNRFEKAALLSANQWKYKATVIETSQEGGFAFVGISTPLRLGRFEFTQEKLRFMHAVSPFSDGGDGNTADLINSWDVDHSEYRLQEVNGQVTNVEEENDKIPWHDKKYFKIEWTSQAIDELGDSSSCFEKINEEIVEGTQEVTRDHFSFVVEQAYELKAFCNSYPNFMRRQNSGNFTYTVRIKHSFAPHEQTDYEPMAYEDEFDPTRQRYGFFQTTVDRMDDETGRFTKDILVNRWDPKKEHTFYFAGDFPEKYKWIYTDPEMGIAAKTNKLFADHGLDVRFKFESDPSKKFGDVRYSFVKWVDKPDDMAPFGYGPSDTDPLTGEILRADSVIWTSALERIVEQIRENLGNEAEDGRGLLLDKMGDVLSQAGIGATEHDWLATADAFDSRNPLRVQRGKEPVAEAGRKEDREAARFELQKIIRENLYTNPAYAASTFYDPFRHADQLDAGLEPQSDDFGTVSRAMTLMDTANVNMSQTAREYLSEVRSNVQRLHDHHGHPDLEYGRKIPSPHTVYPLEEQLAAVKPMMASGKSDQQIIDTILYRVAIHEFGHNLNLRHNFYGSVDYMNFDEPEVQRDRNNKVITDANGEPLMTTPYSSSVMDYLDLYDEYQLDHDWENYDEAALIYAYSGGKIDLDTHKVRKTDEGIELVKRDKPRQLLYCTDEHRAWQNPFCNVYDVGTTPSEIVLSMIKRYDRAYEIRNKRFDRAYWDTRSYASRVASDIVGPIKFLALYNEINSFMLKMTEYSKFVEENRVDDYVRIRQEITDDTRRAAALLAGFYSGLVQTTSVDRNIIDNVDRFTGNVTKIGILTDKLYSMMALGSSWPIAIANDDQDPFEINFLYFSEEPGELGRVLDKALLDIAVDNVELVVRGFESFGRSMIASTASVNPTMLNKNYVKRMEVRCYTKAGLMQAFGIDADRYYPYFDGHAELTPLVEDSPELNEQLETLNAVQVKVGGVEEPNVGRGRYPVLAHSELDPAITQSMVVVRIGDQFYTAPKMDERGYAYEFIRRGIDLQGNYASPTMQQYILQTKLFFDYSFYGREEPCIEYEAGL